MGRRSSKRVRTPTATITESGDQPEEGIEEEELNNDKIEEIQLEEEGEEGEYEIECIVAARVVAQPKGKKSATNWEYYVRWAGYGPDADEWVQTSDIDADVLIKRFWKHIEWDDRDYFPGDTMKAREQWIEEQHELFVAKKKREKEEEAHEKRKSQSQSPRKRNEVDDTPTPRRSIRQHDKSNKVEHRSSPRRSKKRKTRAAASSDVDMSSNEESTSAPEPVSAPDSITDEQETLDEPQDHDRDSLFDGSSSDEEDHRIDTPQPPPPLTPPPSDPPALRDPRRTAEKQARSSFASVSVADSESANEHEPANTSAHATKQPRKPISRPKIIPMFMSGRANPVAGPSKLTNKKRPGMPPFLVPRPATSSQPSDAREKSLTDVEMSDIDQIEQFPPNKASSRDVAARPQVEAQDVTMTSSSSATDVSTFLFPAESRASSAIIPEPASASDGWSRQVACHIFSDASKRSSCTVIIREVQAQLPNDGREPLQALLKQVFGTAAKHRAINLEKLVPASQLPIHLAATSGRWTQLVRIEPKDTRDRKLLEATTVYLRRRLSVSFVPLNKRRSNGTDNSLGIMIIFPNSNVQLCQSLHIPSALLGSDDLLGAVYPWALSAYRYLALSEGISPVSLKPDGPPYPLRSSPAQIKRTELQAEQAVLYRAVVLLRFPYELMDRIKRKGGVTYAVWSLHDAHVHEVPDMETRALSIVMTRFKSRSVRLDAHPHMIFIHVGALATLYRSSALMQLRASRPDVSFKLYGTHISMRPSSWGIRDIWPLGGIITFTPEVLVKHSVKVAVLIASLRADPTWASFILPSVLGAVMKRRNLAVDPLELHSLGIDVQPAEIITAINQGHVALMRLPRRLEFTTDITISENVLWQYEELVEPVEGNFVKSALEKFEKLARDRTPEAVETELKKEINSHMKDFQTQTPMITNYRRYVVIGVEGEAPAYAATYTWCEFATLSSFNRSS